MTQSMNRRRFLGVAGTAALTVGLAGCSEREDQCIGEGCTLIDEWTWDWEDNGALNPSTLQVNIIPEENAPPLRIVVRGYDTAGAGDARLSYANTYEVIGPKTIIEEGLDPIHSVDLEVSPTDES